MDDQQRSDQNIKNIIKKSAEIITRESARIQQVVSEEADETWYDASSRKCDGDRDVEEVVVVGGVFSSRSSSSEDDLRGKKRSLSPVEDGSSQKKSKLDLKKLEREKEEIRQENLDLGRKLRKSQADCKDLSLRLSKEMEVKVSRDESSLENICVKNRPMNVAEAYQMFCSDAWLDAKSALDDYMDDPSEESERERLTLLHDILMIAQKVITSVHSEMLTQIRAPLEQVDQPLLFMNQKGKQVKSSRKQDEYRGSNFQQFENAVGDILRARADKIDCKQFRQLVYTALAENHPDVEDIVEHVAEVDVYTEKACSIVWKMVLQRPQMTFDTPGLGSPWMGDAYQDVFWGSDDPDDPSSTVAFYVHPVLYHGDKVMAKGKVILKKSLPNVESKEGKHAKTEEVAEGKEPKAKAEAKEDLEEVKRGRASKATPKRRNMKK